MVSENEKQKYIYRWGNNEKRKTLKGRICIALVSGEMNTCLIEFIDSGERVTTSRNAIKKYKRVV